MTDPQPYRQALRHFFHNVCLLLMLAIAVPGTLSADLNLPDMGDPSAATLSPGQEQQLGRTLLREVRRTLPLEQDPLINAYVQALGQRLVSSTPDAHAHFRFLVVDDPRINAFAMPGGIVGVNTGLIAAARDESELAAVIAHEIAHVTQRHLARMYADSARIDLATGLAMLAGIIAAAYDPQLGQAAIVGGMAAGTQARINHTRANEQEADRIGISILAAAEYDPHSMPRFFERMLQLSRANPDSIPDFLRTHPVTTARISDSRARADQYEDRDYRRDSTEFVFTLARVKARIDAAQTVAEFQRGRDQDKPEARYGYAVALLERGETTAAREAIDALTDEDAPRLSLQLLRAEIAQRERRLADALSILEGLNDIYPRHAPVIHAYAEVLLDARRPEDALALLDRYLAQSPDDPQLIRLKARAADQAGQRAVSHETMAEYYFYLGRYGESLHQLEMALQAPDLTAFVEERVRDKRNIVRDWVR
ncbi:M48 family metalloprotease [Thioalkalivibrio thiocyanodenitrificans]|uniref:M48 family metalloprotease n=1 Tax=Thioalkalivibrio thiocyanodenitrificans TaxID=243063 RepID=UPI0003A6ECA8|nr:M48 family metalloprotease [Thioalkalivibrio thiocyanodenitrificans]